MPRHKKRTRLPNGYGSICFLGKGRRRPYAVYPCANKRTEDGRTIRPQAIGYAETYNDAMELLVMHNRGLELPEARIVPKHGPTFAEVYQRYYDDKFNGAKQFSYRSEQAAKIAFRNSSVLHDREFASITYPELQAVLDNCPLKHASLELIKSLFRGMYKYAEKYELVEKDQSKHLEIRIPDDDEHGVSFTDEEIARLWHHKADTDAQMILVMIYSGFRISAYESLKTALAPDWYFQGGIKTKAGKDRIVPIHSAIRDIVAGLIANQGIVVFPSRTMGYHMKKYLPAIGIATDHTPHDCRHTFSYLCEKYDVPENDRRRLLGHAFADVTNGVYGHRTIEQLRESIEKIKVPYNLL